jgi:hypothetical protein
MTMAESSSDQDQTAPTPPADPRPQPRYGELAPEGWTWTPPQDDTVHSASAVVTPAAAVQTRGSAESSVSASPAPPARPTAPGWDRPLTISLLVFGLLGAYFTISMLATLTESLQMIYTQADLGTYTPAESVATIVTAGTIGQAVLWLATAAVSVLLLLRRRRAFYVPLIGGVVAFVLLVGAMTAVLAGDATLLDYFSRP